MSTTSKSKPVEQKRRLTEIYREKLAESEDLVNRRRSEILLAAIECFGEKGFVATKMKDIATRAQMSVGSLYNYFNNKDDIVETLAQEQTDKLIEKIKRANRDVPTKQMRDLAGIAMTRLNLKNAIFALDIMNATTSNERLLKILQRYDKVCREALLETYKNKNYYNPEAKLDLDMCLLDGLIIRAIADPTLNAERLAKMVARQIVMND